MQQMEVTAIERINFDISQFRHGFEQQIKQLEDKLKLSFQNQHLRNNMLSQRDTLINQLQAQITTIERTLIDISSFKKQALEVNEKLQIVQQNLYESLDAIQKNYQVINNYLHIIDDKEKKYSMGGSKFQEFIVWRKNLNVPGLAPFFRI